MPSWRLKVFSTRSVCLKTRYCKGVSPTCWRGLLAGHRSTSSVTTSVSTTRPRAGTARAGWGAKIEWHPGQLIPTYGFIVTNLSRSADRVSAFYNQRRKAEQYIKEGKHAIKWTRLSCQKFRNNEVRLQLHARAYKLANFMRTLALPRSMARWSLTTLREKLVKIGAKMVCHGRYVTFQMAEVAVSGRMFGQILARIVRLRAPPVPA